MSKHTPGSVMKWMVGTPLPASGLKPDQRIICTAEIESTVIAIVDKQYAGLIVAAPELLEACKDLLVLFDEDCDAPDCDACELLKPAKAAIAKATEAQ